MKATKILYYQKNIERGTLLIFDTINITELFTLEHSLSLWSAKPHIKSLRNVYSNLVAPEHLKVAKYSQKEHGLS